MAKVGKRKVLKMLIPHYKNAINKLNKIKKFSDVRNEGSDLNVNHGICACAMYEFGIDIYRKDWVRKHCNGSNYWATEPSSTTNKEKYIMALQKRLDIMEKIYWELEK